MTLQEQKAILAIAIHAAFADGVKDDREREEVHGIAAALGEEPARSWRWCAERNERKGLRWSFSNTRDSWALFRLRALGPITSQDQNAPRSLTDRGSQNRIVNLVNPAQWRGSL